jgi:exo-poly-alpha-galacturonosidase
MKNNYLFSLIAVLLCAYVVFGQTTISYNLRDSSTFLNTGIQWEPVLSTSSPDGKLRTQAATTLWHSSGYGVSFRNGNVLEVDVLGGNSTIRFYGSIHSSGNLIGGTSIGASDIGTMNVDLDTHPGMTDQTGYYEFNYSGGPTTLYFTFSGSNAYTPAIDIVFEEATFVKTDVWDFGAEQLDEVLFNNMLTTLDINNWYDSSITVGSSGNVLPSSWVSGALTWVGGSNDRLRTSNTALTRFDQNLGGASTVTGRVYVNSSGATGRYMRLSLNEDDEVNLMMSTQSGLGIVHFQLEGNPAEQDDIIAVGSALQEVKFVAKTAGDYRIFDEVDKPSYYRISKKEAEYVTLSGTVDELLAADVPQGYAIVFTNESGKNFNAIVSNGSYTINLPSDYNYNLSLAGANGFIITNGSTLFVNQQTTNYNIVIAQVDIYNVTGIITGLVDLTGVTIHFTPDPEAESLFNPIVTLDQAAFTYSVDLEAGIQYTISADGINDFEILNNTIEIEPVNQTANINFTAKPLYYVAINAINLNQIQTNSLNLTFINLIEEGYNYTFTDVSSIQLRDGIYKVSSDGLDEYPLELALTSNLQVNGSDTSKDLTFNQITKWTFTDRVVTGATAYKGLLFTGNVNVRGNNGDLNAGNGATISIPVKVGEKLVITDYFASNYSIEGGAVVTNTSNSTSTNVITEYVFPGTSDGTVTINVGGTSYFISFEVVAIEPYSPTLTVGTDKNYRTINEALDAITRMERPNDESVSVLIDPGNYEEMLVIRSNNIKLLNASSNPSIALLNQGVSIDNEAVRITSYYGQKYNFFSQGTDNKWSAEALAVNLENGYTDYVNQEGTGGGSSYWNATVVVNAKDFIAKDIIFENSFNQYISFKESQDVVMPKAASEPIRPTDFGNTDVQDRSQGYVTQAAALALAPGADRVFLNNCRVVGRQDSFYGAQGARVALYQGAIMGAVDYIFGGMTAVFYQSDLILNTSDHGSDVAYITAAQQTTSPRGYLMYECHVKSPVPGVETASAFSSKPGLFGRPWAPNTSEVVFYNTIIDESDFPGQEGLSLILPQGWSSSLGGQSTKMYEYGTLENATGIDNSGSRVNWATTLVTPTLLDGTIINTFNFTKGLDDWDPFSDLVLSNAEPNFNAFANAAAYNQMIHVTNIKAQTSIQVFGITGSLIQEFETQNDISFGIPNGIWFVKLIVRDQFKVFKLISN